MKRPTQLVYKICNRIVRQTNWYNYSYWNGATKFWNDKQFGLDVVNLGSGAAVHAFNYEGLNILGRNWALGPQSLEHDYNILRNYFSFIREGGYVIITICPFSCLFSQYNKKHNFKYYTFLHPATIISFDDDERTRALRIKTNPFREMPLYCIKATVVEFVKRFQNTFISHKTDLQVSAKSLIDNWKQQFGIDNLDSPLNSQHLFEQGNRRRLLEEMISFMRERFLVPVVVIPPMHHSLSDNFSHAFKNNYVDTFLKGVDCQVLDYMYDIEMDKDDYYSTSLFLNSKGASVFTHKVLSDIGLLSKDKIMM